MLYATWPMRGAARVCYAGWRERGPLVAVNAENRSLRKGSTPPGPHVVTDLPGPCAARQRLATARGLREGWSWSCPLLLTPTFVWSPRLWGARGETGHDE